MVLVLDLSCLLQGTTCVYTTFLQPFVSRHELDIDQNLNELRTRAGEMAVVWWQRGSVYAQAHFYELLDYMASQSNRAHPTISPPVHPGNAPQTPCEPTQVPPQVCACLPLFSMLCWQLQNLLQKSNRTSGGRVFWFFAHYIYIFVCPLEADMEFYQLIVANRELRYLSRGEDRLLWPRSTNVYQCAFLLIVRFLSLIFSPHSSSCSIPSPISVIYCIPLSLGDLGDLWSCKDVVIDIVKLNLLYYIHVSHSCHGGHYVQGLSWCYALWDSGMIHTVCIWVDPLPGSLWQCDVIWC